MAAYKACLVLIKTGRTEGLAEKLDLFLAFERITIEQYTELMGMLPVERESAE